MVVYNIDRIDEQIRDSDEFYEFMYGYPFRESRRLRRFDRELWRLRRQYPEVLPLSNRRLVHSYFEITKKAFRILSNPENNKQSQKINEAWATIVIETNNFMSYLEFEKFFQFIGKIHPHYFGEYSLSEDEKFKEIEEGLLADLSIPKNAWSKFWHIVHQNERELIQKIIENRFEDRYNINQILNFGSNQITEGPGILKPLSPFNWAKGIAAGMGSLLAMANTLTFGVIHPGFTVASVVAAATGIGYAQGR